MAYIILAYLVIAFCAWSCHCSCLTYWQRSRLWGRLLDAGVSFNAHYWRLLTLRNPWRLYPAEPASRAQSAERSVGDLLAIIHGDGGHYQAEHGTEKAAADAIPKVYALMKKLAEQPDKPVAQPAGVPDDEDDAAIDRAAHVLQEVIAENDGEPSEMAHDQVRRILAAYAAPSAPEGE